MRPSTTLALGAYCRSLTPIQMVNHRAVVRRGRRRARVAKADRKLTRKRNPAARVSYRAPSGLRRQKEGAKASACDADALQSDVSFAQQCLSDGCLCCQMEPAAGEIHS